MGEGNVVIQAKNGTPAINTYYIELDEMFDNPDYVREYIKEDIQNIKLKNSLLKDELYQSNGNNYLIIIETKVMQVLIADNERNIAIACIIVEDVEFGRCMKLAFKKQANYFMCKLNEIFKLSIRTSAWTSGNIVKEFKEFY